MIFHTMSNLYDFIVTYQINYHVYVDLFVELLPVGIHNALSAYETRRNELVNYEVSNLREMTQLLNRYTHKVTIYH